MAGVCLICLLQYLRMVEKVGWGCGGTKGQATMSARKMHTKQAKRFQDEYENENKV